MQASLTKRMLKIMYSKVLNRGEKGAVSVPFDKLKSTI